MVSGEKISHTGGRTIELLWRAKDRGIEGRDWNSTNKHKKTKNKKGLKHCDAAVCQHFSFFTGEKVKPIQVR
jgi:hypothetical protein